MKCKPVNYERFDRDSRDSDVYELMDDLIAKYHPDLAEANIILCWRTGLKEDKDGRLVLGQAKKASDAAKELAEHDFIIYLNHDFYRDASTTDEHRRYLLDHELSHCAPDKVEDANGNECQRTDERGRKLWRIRKHDIEEFTGVVNRHDVWMPNVQELARVILAKQQRSRTPLFVDQPQPIVGN